MADKNANSSCEPPLPLPNGQNPPKRRRPKRQAVITKQVSPQDAKHHSDVHHIGKGTYYQAQILPSASCGRDAKRLQSKPVSSSASSHASPFGEQAILQPVMESDVPNQEKSTVSDREQSKKYVSVDANRMEEMVESQVDFQSSSITGSPECAFGRNLSTNHGNTKPLPVIRPTIHYEPKATDQDGEEVVIDNQSFKLRRLNNHDQFSVRGEIAQIFAWCRDKDGNAHYLLTMQNNAEEAFLVPRDFFNAERFRGNALAHFYQSFLKPP